MTPFTRRTLLKAIAASPFAAMMWPLRADASDPSYSLPDAANVNVTVTVTSDVWTKFQITSLTNGEPASSVFLDGANTPPTFVVPMDVHTQVLDPTPVISGNGNMDSKAWAANRGVVGAQVGGTTAGTTGLKAILTGSTGLWQNSWAGPYAVDRSENSESYLMAYPDLITPANVQQWIEILGQCRITWLAWADCFRPGCYGAYTDRAANTVAANYDDVSSVLTTLGAAGISSMLHVYSHMMLEDSVIDGEVIQDHAGVDAKQSTSQPTMHGGGDVYVPDPVPVNVAAADAIAEEVADNIITVLNLGFAGIYFDYLSFCTDIQGADASYWWAQKFVNYIGTNGGLTNKNIRVGSAWQQTCVWNCLSMRGTTDQGAEEAITDFADRVEGIIASKPNWGLPTDFGWFRADASDSDADINYALDKVEDNSSPFSFRGLAPSVWSQAGMQRLARLIGNRTPVQRTRLSTMATPIREV